MASNPKTWSGPTPWSHSGQIDKSGPSRELKHNATRPHEVAPTSMDHFQPTPHSGSGYPELGNSGNKNMGLPYALSSDRSEISPSMAMPGPVSKSKPEPPRDVKKWHKSGRYKMDAAPMTTAAQGKAFAKSMKAR